MIIKVLRKIVSFLPSFIEEILRKLYRTLQGVKLYFQILHTQKKSKTALLKIRNKERIRVAFFLIHESIWKYDELYKLMEKDDRFEPVIVVCPFTTYGEEAMHKELDQTYKAFKQKGLNVINTYDKEDGEWLDVKKEVNPDMIFFTNPWKLTRDEYYITNYLDKLTCYVPYFFVITKHLKENYGGVLQNLAWKVFYETPIHLEFARKYSKNSAKNVLVTGYPGLDIYFNNEEKADEFWYTSGSSVKKIIWAPHHSIEGQDSGLAFSNFTRYAIFFKSILETYKSKIAIAFKPHPLLKPKLYENKDWGKAKTDSYYDEWNELENGMLSEGEYSKLFISSDAIIHDSGSFTAEYLATYKPALYTVADSAIENRLNKFGRLAFKEHYHAKNEEEIINFIENIVLGEQDFKKASRENFVEQYLLPPNGNLASQNIFNALKELTTNKN